MSVKLTPLPAQSLYDANRFTWEQVHRIQQSTPQNGGPAARLNDAEAPVETPAVAAAEPVERERAPKPAGPAGGVYIPPFKLAQMMRDADDKEGKVQNPVVHGQYV
jgi:hypothetical protein